MYAIDRPDPQGVRAAPDFSLRGVLPVPPAPAKRAFASAAVARDAFVQQAAADASAAIPALVRAAVKRIPAVRALAVAAAHNPVVV